MPNDKVDVPIKITLDGTDIRKLVKEEINSVRNDEKDKLLLKLMMHYYEEDERRNELIDSKNSQMIIFSGAMLTLQTTLITKLFVDAILLNDKITLNFYCELLILMSIIFYYYYFCFFLKKYFLWLNIYYKNIFLILI